jgi:hypothetical protein
MVDHLTRREQEDLLKLVRQRERVAKSAAAARSAELIADFEAQLDRRYAFDEDQTWHAATAAAQTVVAEAQQRIASRCRELGIPADFAPRLSIGWSGQGRNSVRAERTDMRRLAARRVEQIEASAKLAIEQASVAAQERLWVDGLTSDAAREFLTCLPTAETLMPLLEMEKIQATLVAPKAFASQAVAEIES